METMWAYQYTGRKIEKIKASIPKVRPNDVLVQVDKATVCGSDFHIFAIDDWARETVTPNIIIGHEGCGRIVELGANVQSLSVGDYVALESHYACPHCESEGKNADACSHYGIIGIHGSQFGSDDHEISGVFSEYIAIPEYCCYKLPAEVEGHLMSASLLEPAGNSWEIIRWLKENNLVPKSLAIFGCGPHSLNLQLFARHIGIPEITAFETDQWRLNFAKNFNEAHDFINPASLTSDELDKLTDSFEMSVDMAGNIHVVELCKSITKDSGHILLFGLPKHEALVTHGENFAEIIFNNEIHHIEHNGKQFTLRGFTGRTAATWKELLQELQSSPSLCQKLSTPLQILGNIHDLERFIQHQPEHFLKAGFQMNWY